MPTRNFGFRGPRNLRLGARCIMVDRESLRWLERVLVFFDAIYLGVEIFRLDFANHDQILPQNNDNI